MEKLPTEMLLETFQLLSFEDLKTVMLVCRRWRKIGEMLRLWSSLSILVTTRSMSLMPKILSSSRFPSVEKLRIKSPLSKRVSESILRHPRLRDFEVIMGSGTKTIISILKLICSKGSRGIVLNLEYNDISGVNPELMVGVIDKLEELEKKLRNNFHFTPPRVY